MTNGADSRPMARAIELLSSRVVPLLPRIAICMIGYVIAMEVLTLAGFTPNAVRAKGASADVSTLSVFFLTSVIVLSGLWVAPGLLPKLALSLGYKKSYPSRFDRARGSDDLVEPSVEPHAVTIHEKYDGSDILSPLESSRRRLLDHVASLRNNAVVSLLVGIALATTGVALMVYTGIAVDERLGDPRVESRSGVAAFGLVAINIGYVVLLQVSAYICLSVYRGTQGEIRFFLNEITSLDSLATAVIAAQRPGNSPNMKLVVTALSRNERNRVMKSDERPIPLAEFEIARESSSASRKSARIEKVSIDQE
jgi:hypothetical protein